MPKPGSSGSARNRRGYSLSLRLLIDADTQDRILVRLLRNAGHDVLTASEAGLRIATDLAIFETARSESRMMLTRNIEHFQALHEAQPDHPGILGIYESDTRR